jgi:hypothetical protein
MSAGDLTMTPSSPRPVVAHQEQPMLGESVQEVLVV